MKGHKITSESNRQLNDIDSISMHIGKKLDSELENSRYTDNPIGYVEKHFGYPWQKQKEIIEAIFLDTEHKIILVRSCNDVGKTWVIGAIHWAWLDLYRYNARVVTTATNYSAVKFMQWSAIRDHYNKIRDRFDNATINLTDFTPYPDQHPKFQSMGLNPQIEGERHDPNAKATAFQGHHSEHTLFIVDEAMSTPPAIMSAIEGSLLDESSKALIVFNPTSRDGMVVEMERSDKRVKLITISTDDLFNSKEYKKNPDYYKELANKKAVQQLIDTYGETSPIVLARVKGEYPNEDINSALSYHYVKQCVERRKEWKDKELERVYRITYSWDVAGEGTDKNELSKFESGYLTFEQETESDKDVKEITKQVHKHTHIKEWNADHNESLKIVYDIIFEDLLKWKEKVKDSKGDIEMPMFYVVVDAVGEGSHVPSVFDEWFEDENLITTAFKGGSSTDGIVEREEVDLMNANAEAWYRTKLLTENSIKEWGFLMLDADTECIGQLTSRKRFWKNRRGEPMLWQIEPKDEYKKRAGGVSPDKADSIIMGIYNIFHESSVLMI